eukprot:gene12458-6209_t
MKVLIILTLAIVTTCMSSMKFNSQETEWLHSCSKNCTYPSDLKEFTSNKKVLKEIKEITQNVSKSKKNAMKRMFMNEICSENSSPCNYGIDGEKVLVTINRRLSYGTHWCGSKAPGPITRAGIFSGGGCKNGGSPSYNGNSFRVTCACTKVFGCTVRVTYAFYYTTKEKKCGREGDICWKNDDCCSYKCIGGKCRR